MYTTNFKAALFRASCILHMSDLHIGKHEVKMYLDSLSEFLINEKKIPTHILITGDIVDSPCKKSFIIAAKLISEFYCKVSDHCTRLIIVPGNHDRLLLGNRLFNMCNKIFRFEHKWNDFVKKLKGDLWAFKSKDEKYCGWNEIVKNVYCLEDAVVRLGRKARKLQQPKDIEIIGCSIMDIEHRLLFFLFDSTPGKAFSFARGEPTKKQIKFAEWIINRYKEELWVRRSPEHLKKLAMAAPYFLVIACMHHHLLPTPYKQLCYKKIWEWGTETKNPRNILYQLEQVIRCDLLLTGHKHYPRIAPLCAIASENQASRSLQAGMLIQQAGSASKGAKYKNQSFHPNSYLIEIKTADLKPEIRDLRYDNTWKIYEIEKEHIEHLCNSWHANKNITERRVVEDNLGIADLRHKVALKLNGSGDPNYVATTVKHQLRLNVTRLMTIFQIIDLTLPSKFWFPGGGEVKIFKWRKDNNNWIDIPQEKICYIGKKGDKDFKILLNIEELKDECKGSIEIKLLIEGEKLLCRTKDTYYQRYKENSYEEDVRLELPIGAQMFELILVDFQKAYPSKEPELRVHTWSAPTLDKEGMYEPNEFSELIKETKYLQQSIICNGDIRVYKGTMFPPCSAVWIHWSLDQ